MLDLFNLAAILEDCWCEESCLPQGRHKPLDTNNNTTLDRHIFDSSSQILLGKKIWFNNHDQESKNQMLERAAADALHHPLLNKLACANSEHGSDFLGGSDKTHHWPSNENPSSAEWRSLTSLHLTVFWLGKRPVCKSRLNSEVWWPPTNTALRLPAPHFLH